MNTTPASERLRIVITGECNSGKSSLINALCGQEVAIVADTAGTTTDPVGKAVELPGAGACTIVDTAGTGDTTPLGSQRTARTSAELAKADIVIALTDTDGTPQSFAGKPVIHVLPKADLLSDPEKTAAEIAERSGQRIIAISSATGYGLDTLRREIAAAAARNDRTITGNLLRAGDTALLVMPQDPQAPRGRLILPQSATLRELLEKNVTAICCTPPQLAATLDSLRRLPDLTITDSQVFAEVNSILPGECRLTSFSILMAGYKGDIDLFVKGAEALDRLTASSRVLIAEACAHAPQNEDIGRVKIPRLLRKRVGEGLTIDFVSGADFPSSLSGYDLVVHCGGCMFTRNHVMARAAAAETQGVAVTNYGILMARAQGILDRVVWPSGQ